MASSVPFKSLLDFDVDDLLDTSPEPIAFFVQDLNSVQVNDILLIGRMFVNLSRKT